MMGLGKFLLPFALICSRVLGSDLKAVFLLACEEGDMSAVDRILCDHPDFDLSSDDQHGFKAACARGHAPLVARLLKDCRVNPGVTDNSALKTACRTGHLEVVKLLLADGRVDPAAGNQTPLRAALSHDHLGIVRLLVAMPTVNRSALNHKAILEALGLNYKEPILILLGSERTDVASTIVYASAKSFFYDVLDHPRVSAHLMGLSLEDIRGRARPNMVLSALWNLLEQWQCHGWSAFHISPTSTLEQATGFTLAFHHHDPGSLTGYMHLLRLLLPFLGQLTPWRLQMLVADFHQEGDKFVLVQFLLDQSKAMQGAEGRWSIYQILGRLYILMGREPSPSWSSELRRFLVSVGYFEE